MRGGIRLWYVLTKPALSRCRCTVGTLNALAPFYCNTECHYRIKQIWESASGHFAMQMLRREKRVCASERQLFWSTPHLKANVFFSEAHFLRSPGADCGSFGHVFLSVCIFHSASDLSPAGRQAAHLNRNARGLYPSNFPHGAGIQTDTGDLARVQEANHIHVIVSHGMKKWKKKGLGKQIAINVRWNADANALVCKAPFVAFVRLGGGPLKRAKRWHNDIEKRSIVYRMKEERRREERKGCTLIQLAALARSNYLYSP